MVARNGQPLAVGCFPVRQFVTPLRATADCDKSSGSS